MHHFFNLLQSFGTALSMLIIKGITLFCHNFCSSSYIFITLFYLSHIWSNVHIHYLAVFLSLHASWLWVWWISPPPHQIILLFLFLRIIFWFVLSQLFFVHLNQSSLHNFWWITVLNQSCLPLYPSSLVSFLSLL